MSSVSSSKLFLSDFTWTKMFLFIFELCNKTQHLRPEVLQTITKRMKRLQSREEKGRFFVSGLDRKPTRTTRFHIQHRRDVKNSNTKT